jgi:hypothetical protein
VPPVRIRSMRYSLRSLVMATLVTPPLLAAIWFWGELALYVLVGILGLLLYLAVLLAILAVPLAIPFALAGLFCLVQKGILWLVSKVFNEHPV